MGGRIAQQPLRFADISLTVAHVAGPEVAVNRLGVLQVRAARRQKLMKLAIESVESGAFTHSHIVDLILRRRVLRGGGQQIGLHCIIDEQKSRQVSPSPLMNTASPLIIAAVHFGITAAYAPFGSCRAPKTLK